MAKYSTSLTIVFISDVIKKRIFKRLVYTPPDLSPRFTCKVKLSYTKFWPDFIFWLPF